MGKVEDAKPLDDVFAIARSKKGYPRHIDGCCAEDALKSVLALNQAPDVYWETKGGNHGLLGGENSDTDAGGEGACDGQSQQHIPGWVIAHVTLVVAASSYSTRGDITDAVVNAAAASEKRAHL